MKRELRDLSENDDLPEIADIKIDRVDVKIFLDLIGEGIDIVEDRGHVLQQLQEDRPEIFHVAEENVKRRKHQPGADVEDHQQQDGVDQHQEFPGEGDVIDGAEGEVNEQGQPEIDQCLDIFGQEKQIFRDVDLGEDPRVVRK